MSTAGTPSFGRAIGLLLCALFFGGQGYYFYSVKSAFDGLIDEGIDPTIYGLAIVASLLAVGALVSALRVSAARVAKAKKDQAGAATWSSDDGSNPNADAIVDRYLAERRTPPRKGLEHRATPPKSARPQKPAPREFSRRAR